MEASAMSGQAAGAASDRATLRPVVDIRGLSLTYEAADGPVYALSDVDLQVGEGEFVSFIGPSGCGKTTLLRVIADHQNGTSSERQPVRVSNLSGDDNAPVWQIVNIWEGSDAFEELVRNPILSEEIGQLMEAAMGAREIRLFHDQIQYKPAQKGGVNMWHQDSPYWPVLQPKDVQLTAWVALDADGPRTLTLAAHLPTLDRPCELAERLPKALIHHNVPGQPVHDLLTALDDAWDRAAAYAAYGPRQRWTAACASLPWPQAGPVRHREGELTVPWDTVAPR